MRQNLILEFNTMGILISVQDLWVPIVADQGVKGQKYNTFYIFLYEAFTYRTVSINN